MREAASTSLSRAHAQEDLDTQAMVQVEGVQKGGDVAYVEPLAIEFILFLRNHHSSL